MSLVVPDSVQARAPGAILLFRALEDQAQGALVAVLEDHLELLLRVLYTEEGDDVRVAPLQGLKRADLVHVHRLRLRRLRLRFF